MRLIAEIDEILGWPLEGTIQCGEHRDQPIPFSGTLELLRILEDEVPIGPGSRFRQTRPPGGTHER